MTDHSRVDNEKAKAPKVAVRQWLVDGLFLLVMGMNTVRLPRPERDYLVGFGGLWLTGVLIRHSVVPERWARFVAYGATSLYALFAIGHYLAWW